jgi:hypothetical protein
MKTTLVLIGALAVLAATASASQRPLAARANTSPSLLRLPRATSAGEQTLWGHIRSLTRERGRWQMKFDPALLLFGTAAEQAQFEDTGMRGPVANDSYTVDESHRVYAFTVSPRARITVLTRGLKTATVGLSEFAQILRGENPKRRPLFGQPKRSGFWIRVGTKYPNPVASIDEQYQP